PRPCLFAPAGAPIGAEFPLEVGSMKIEGIPMIERAAALRPQTAAVVSFAPMRGKLSTPRREIAKHELAAIDIGCPGSRNDVDPDREKGISCRGNQPPSAGALLCVKKAGCTNPTAPKKPAKAVAIGSVSAPLVQFFCFLGTTGAQHLGRAHFLRPSARAKLAESINDP